MHWVPSPPYIKLGSAKSGWILIFSLNLVLYVGELSPSLLQSQALFYYTCTYVNTFIFYSKKASGRGEMIDKAHTLGRYEWGSIIHLIFPSHSLLWILPSSSSSFPQLLLSLHAPLYTQVDLPWPPHSTYGNIIILVKKRTMSYSVI